MNRARALLWPAVFAGLTVALLVGLGFWQLRRLGEKEALIARIETRATAAPAEAPPRAEWRSLAPNDYDFRHVQVSGRYLPARDALIYAPPPEGFGPEPGYLVLTPFELTRGGVVLVDRGFLAGSRATAAARQKAPDAETTITGLMRAPQTRNLFTPADEPSRSVWYTRDPAAIASTLGLADAAPFSVSLDAPPLGAPAPDGVPRPVAGAPSLVNNHLSYAFTWFSLAAALVVIFALYARNALGAPQSPPD